MNYSTNYCFAIFQVFLITPLIIYELLRCIIFPAEYKYKKLSAIAKINKIGYEKQIKIDKFQQILFSWVGVITIGFCGIILYEIVNYGKFMGFYLGMILVGLYSLVLIYKSRIINSSACKELLKIKLANDKNIFDWT
jgi:hypothetical protein